MNLVSQTAGQAFSQPVSQATAQPLSQRRARTRQWLKAATALVGLAALSACYVVPIHPDAAARPAAVVTVPAPALPSPVTFSARLYPANDSATAYGVVAAVVTSDLSGRGTFSTNIGGESFQGEATRLANGSREGIANGSGNRGGYINCRYQMNSATLGTGTCNTANGARFSMHIGG